MKLPVTIAVLMSCSFAIAQSNTSPGGTPSPSNDASMGQDISNSSDTPAVDPNVTDQQRMENGSKSSEEEKRKSQSSGSIQHTTSPSTTSPSTTSP